MHAEEKVRFMYCSFALWDVGHAEPVEARLRQVDNF